MNVVELFAGIAAPSVALHPLGFKTVAFSEIEKFPSDLLKTRFPDTPNEGDITKVDWTKYRGSVDLAIGGSPCQSFSVAGLRKGLMDPRGNLMLEYLRAVSEIRPKWVIWENVPGVLSSNGGRDFAALIGGLEELGYGVAYRVFDAQFFGVSQRRRRVFVVGCFGSWQCAAAVLFESDSLSGNTQTSKEKREELAATGRDSSTYSIAGNTIGREEHNGGNGVGVAEEVGYTLTSTDQHGVVSAFSAGQSAKAGSLGYAEELSPTLRGASSGTNQVPAVLSFPPGQITCPKNRSNPEIGDPCHTLDASDVPAVVSIDCRNAVVNEEISGTLQAKENGGYSLNYQNPVFVLADDNANSAIDNDLCGTLKSGGGGTDDHCE